MKVKNLRLGVSVALMLTPALAWSYIPDPQFILARMMKAREGLKTIELVAEIKDAQKPNVLQETLRLDFVNGRYSVSINEAEGAVHALKTDKLTELKGLGQAWIEMAYDPSEFRSREALQVNNVWPEKVETKLIRDSGKVYWSWGEDRQIRIEKDQFVWAGFSDDKKNEILVREQARFPRVIAVRIAGQDRFTYTLKGFKINTPMKWNSVSNVNPPEAPQSSVKEWVELVR